MKDIIDCWLPEIYITWVWSLKIQRIYSQLFFYNSNITDYWIYRQFLLKFSISKLHSLVNLIIIILLKPWYWNPLDLAWLKRFLYFGALKRQISARRFLIQEGSSSWMFTVVKSILQKPVELKAKQIFIFERQVHKNLFQNLTRNFLWI